MDFKSMAVAASMALAACAPAQDSTSVERSEDKSLRKLNPGPKRAYSITMTIENAPGPFAVVRGSAQYDVENHVECGRYVEFPGVYLSMTSLEDFPLTKVSDAEYRGTVYSDLILDEDYFGRGVCRWKLTQAQVILKATGEDADTRFLPDLGAEAVYAQKSEMRYFWKERYPREEGYGRFPELGDMTLDGVPDDRRGEFFAITLTAQEAQP